MNIFKKHIRTLKKAGFILTAVLLCVCLSAPLYATDRHMSASLTLTPELSAKSAVLIDADSGRVLFEKNADQRMSMASTTKIMTALVAIESCPLDKIVEIDKRAVGVEGSSVYLYEGERLSIEDLIYAVLLESANDAAEALAIAVCGSVEGFASLMNKKAEEMGLKNTHFENPHGLDSEEHYTTARELAVIASHAMKNESFKTIVSTYKKTIPLNETEGVRLLMNHNKLLRSYDGCVGVKTGYTKKSGRCLVSAAERDGVKLIAVTLNAPDDWRDHKAMLDYGFSEYESRLLAPIGGEQFIMPVIGGAENYTVLKNISELRITVHKSTPEIKKRTELFNFTYAPVQKGDILGQVVYYTDQGDLASLPLVSSYGVDRIIYKKSLWERFSALFSW